METVKAQSYPFPPLTIDEFAARVEAARALLEEARLDALLITTEANFGYFSGFSCPTWVSPTRPQYLIVPLKGEVHAIIPSGNMIAMRNTSWVQSVEHWPAPVEEDDGISLLAAALQRVAGRHGRIGAELGFEMHLRMPVTDFLRLRTLVAPIEIVDGTSVTRALRMVKSPAEVARIAYAATLTSDAFAALPNLIGVGATERDACLAMRMEILRRGGDWSGYMVAGSGSGGFETINLYPTDRALTAGDLFLIDTGTMVDGYYCDFDRVYAVGHAPSDALRHLNDRVFAATDAGFAAARPGAMCSEIWHAMAKVLGEEAVRGSDVGRMGHGLGRNLTEPPSIHPNDHTVLIEGMVITLEPGIGYTADDGRKCVLVHEENIVIADGGARMLSIRGNHDFLLIA